MKKTGKSYVALHFRIQRQTDPHLRAHGDEVFE
jgi:hypothetical protein